jgi:hypothetical protein
MGLKSFRTVFAVLAMASLFLGGILTQRYLLTPSGAAANSAATSKSTAPKADRLLLQGHGVLQAFHSNGAMFAEWKGHNTISPWLINDIASCVSGAAPGSNGCSFTSNRLLFVGQERGYTGPPGTGRDQVFGTNTVQPIGCGVESDGGVRTFCTGWVSTGSIDITGPNYAIDDASLTGVDGITISPTIPVSAGDRIILTITFTIAG